MTRPKNTRKCVRCYGTGRYGPDGRDTCPDCLGLGCIAVSLYLLYCIGESVLSKIYGG